MKNRFLIPTLMVGSMLASCAKHYQLMSVERSRILIDSRYDAAPDAAAAAFLAPYKHDVDSVMAPVVGSVAQYMAASRPESLLSNLLGDILVWGGSAYGEQPDFAVYNMGGMRAAFAKGTVTVGDVVDVAPFENKICFLTLKGSQVLELFSQIAKRGGEGLSAGVRLVITADGRLVSASVHGKDVDPEASYRVATLDYLAQGNDGMPAFKYGIDLNSPQTEENNVRYIIMSYFREHQAAGKTVDAQIEGRVTVE